VNIPTGRRFGSMLLYRTALVCALALTVAGGCTTTRPATETTVSLPTEGAPFHPVTYLATPQIATDARYHDLMTPDSYMIWVSDDVARIKFALDADVPPANVPEDAPELNDTRFINANFLVFELHIKSAFSDSSIANEFTRDVDLFLADDTGGRVTPASMWVSKATQTLQGSRKKFERTIVVLFPRYDLITGNPTVRYETSYMHVYVQKFDTVYMFEWINAETPTTSVRDYAGQFTDVIQLGHAELYRVLKDLFAGFK